MSKSKKKRKARASQVKSAPQSDLQGSTVASSRFGGIDWAICAGLLLFLAFQAATTWRKWPDLLIDYGRELYVPWQITKGAILYKDILHYYGPFGVSLNAGLFRVFGVGFDTLFISSLVMLAGFTLGLYVLLKRMTDRLAAGLAVFLFLCAFAFGNYVGIGNYNFVSPYSHDTVYGLYLCVGMLAALWAYLSSGKLRWMIPAGLAFGCAYLTKPEITVAAVAVSGLAFLASVWLALKPPIESQSQLEGRPPGRPWIPTDRPLPPNARRFDPGCLFLPWLVFLACALIPVLAFNLWFIAHIPGSAGLISIHNSWVAIFDSAAIRGAQTTLTFTGMDNPGENFRRMATASGLGLLATTILAVLGWVAGRYRKSAPIPALMAAVALLGFITWLLVTVGIDFLQIGHILVATSGLLLVFRASCFVQTDGSRGERALLASRLLWTGLGAALLLKMLLNPRIEHYGFYQAMPATLDLAMFMLFDMPRLQRRFGGAEQLSRIAGFLIVATIAVGLCVRAHLIWNLKSFSVAGGRDTIRTYSENVNPMGAIVEALRTQILLHHTGAKTLMVFPDSVSLNYLFRLKDPSPLFEFVPPGLAFYGQDRLIGDLDRSPPDLIVLITRDLREFGSPVFGYDEVSGRRLIDWMQTRYHVAARIGGDALNPNEAGVILLERNCSPAL